MLNPFADPLRGLSVGHLRDGRRQAADLAGRAELGALMALLVASVILLGLTTIVFKRLEPNFAKVL